MRETLYISGMLFFAYLSFKWLEVSEWIAAAGMIIISAVFAMLLYEGLKAKKKSIKYSKYYYTLLGNCKECKNSIHTTDKLPYYEDIYECPRCGHYNSLDNIKE
jgi:hypothetical protein